MSKGKVYITCLVIFILAAFAANLDYPQFLGLSFFPDIPFKLGLDLQGGTHLVYEADLSGISESQKGEKMTVLRDVIEGRVNQFGVAEPIVQIQGDNRLVVELAGIKDTAEAIGMIGETPYLEFRESLSEEERQLARSEFSQDDINYIIEQYKEQTGQDITEEEVLDQLTANMFKPTELTGEYLENAKVTLDQTTSRPQISLKFKDEGKKLFEDITARNVGKPLAIFLDQRSIVDTDGDGKVTDNDFYAPIVQDKITGGEAVITGEMNLAKAKAIVERLNWGALPVKIGEPVSQQNVGPTLGETSLQQSLKAGLFGLLAVVLFLLIFYRLPGLLASLALLFYVVFMLALFKLIPITLTLAGIGGFILSIGMAIDANILIFSRLKEELKEGKPFSSAVEEGFRRAWPSIRDGNLTTLIVALILFGFGTSFVKGFALTLTIGIIISMISAIIITKSFLRVFVGTKLEKVKFLWQ
ncbi:MAG: protein translocase subunit SecD [Candidatus Nealsonbacteria bacterium]